MKNKGFFADKKHRLIAQIIGFPLLALLIYLMISSSVRSSSDKYKLSHAIDTLQTLSNNIHTAYAAAPDYAGLNLGALQSKNLLPETVSVKDGVIINPYGGNILIGSSRYLDVNDGAFVVVYNGLSKKACVSLLTTPFLLSGIAGVTIKPISVEIPDSVNIKYEASALPMSDSLAQMVCEAEADDTNAITWTFY